MDNWRFIWIASNILIALAKTDNFPYVHILSEVSINRTTNENLFTLTCISDTVFMGCHVEFLVNKSSIDDIRSVHTECYNTAGRCNPDYCKCSDNCKQFTLNILEISKMKYIFGCIGKIKEIFTNIVYSVNASVVFDGKDFQNEINIITALIDNTKSEPSSGIPTSPILAVIVLISVLYSISSLFVL